MMQHEAWIYLADQVKSGNPMSEGMARLAEETAEYLEPLEAEEDRWGDCYCPRCGDYINWGTEFCPYCGQKLSYEDD